MYIPNNNNNKLGFMIKFNNLYTVIWLYDYTFTQLGIVTCFRLYIIIGTYYFIGFVGLFSLGHLITDSCSSKLQFIC